MASAAESNISKDGLPAARTAVLLIAHGSRRAEANQDLVKLARGLRESTGFEIIEVSYLELAEPSIAQGCQSCADQGAQRVLLLPYFLSAGLHVTADLERIRGENAARFPEIDFRLCPHLGLHPKMLDIVADRLAEGLAAK